MGSDQKVDTSQVSVRPLPPATLRHDEGPRWEIQASGQVIGWIETHPNSAGLNVTYLATGIHPLTGRPYRLDDSTDFDERVNAVADFYRDPRTQRWHPGENSRATRTEAPSAATPTLAHPQANDWTNTQRPASHDSPPVRQTGAS
jgi:hypothetical protein